ncbi:MAG: carboxypeptidase-like regulatory domain-containing protein, partial [Tannerellaceae bacterium]|nr:carboxypeptidase-like regulatory domain-containing protein [Tannerellaceae bacterium]
MKIRAIAALLFLLLSIHIIAQERVKITGYVRDADGSPLELVNIRIKNTLNGAMTNEKGYYSVTTT